MNNEDSLNVVFKISNSIDYEVKDKIVTILEKQDHPIQQLKKYAKIWSQSMEMLLILFMKDLQCI